MLKVGIGYDLHRLAEGRKLFLGGIEIPYHKGLLGHSDADVLIHALCDSLLGAIAEGDIGEHFPDSEPKYHGISSMKLLEQVSELIKSKGYSVCNIDAVVIAQEPSLTPFKDKIKEKVSKALNIAKESVSIKAKTNEGVGEIGHSEAISCYVVSLLER